MAAEIVIIGGGVGGTLTANLLARRLAPDAARIRLVDATGRHTYQPGWLHLALDQADSRWLGKDLRRLLDDRVELLVDRASAIAPEGGRVFLEREGTIHYDYLVIATGARLDRTAVPGLVEGAHDFYSLDGAERLREALREFDGGRIVVGVAGVPYKCPPAPLEFAFLVDHALRRHGRRDRATIAYLSPFPTVIDVAEADAVLDPLLARREISVHTDARVVALDPAERTITTTAGAVHGYDLAVVVPPHRSAGVLVDSGLVTPEGWLATDPGTLRARGLADAFALGDCTDLAVSKAGSTAHFEAPVVVEQIVSRVEGREPDPVASHYRGKVRCWLEVGDRRATMVGFDDGEAVRVRKPSRRMYAAKWLFNRLYWHTVPRGRY